MNFGTIKSQCQLFIRPSGTASQTITDNLGTWINERLREVYRLRKWFFLKQTDNISTASGTSDYGLTGSMLYLIEVSMGTKPLRVVPEAQGSAFYRSSGSPEAISVLTSSGALPNMIRVWPTPDGAYSLKVTYTKPLADLSADTDTNYLTDQWPWLVIAAGVSAAFAYLQEDQLAATWTGLFEQQLRMLVRLDLEVEKKGIEHEPIGPPMTPPAPVAGTGA